MQRRSIHEVEDFEVGFGLRDEEKEGREGERGSQRDETRRVRRSKVSCEEIRKGAELTKKVNKVLNIHLTSLSSDFFLQSCIGASAAWTPFGSRSCR